MYNVFSVVFVFSMLSLGRILISHLLVANLLMYSLPGMIILYLATPFFTLKGFLDEIDYTGTYYQCLNAAFHACCCQLGAIFIWSHKLVSTYIPFLKPSEKRY